MAAQTLRKAEADQAEVNGNSAAPQQAIQPGPALPKPTAKDQKTKYKTGNNYRRTSKQVNQDDIDGIRKKRKHNDAFKEATAQYARDMSNSNKSTSAPQVAEFMSLKYGLSPGNMLIPRQVRKYGRAPDLVGRSRGPKPKVPLAVLQAAAAQVGLSQVLPPPNIK